MPAPDRVDLSPWLKETKAWTESHLEGALRLLDLGPPKHREAIEYALMAGGKRLRPALVRLVCSSLGGSDSAAAHPAVAIEMIHTYSLVHDDLPCMDDDDLRRGRPTCHVVYGEDQAVLVGDGLQALAFEVLGGSDHPRAADMVAVLARASGPAGMVGGQALDLAAGADDDVDAVRDIHRMKTAALVGAAAELGALAAEAEEAQVEAARSFGLSLGLCFQAVDDVLDVVGDAKSLGKTPGKDAAADKATLVRELGLDGAREEARRHGEKALSSAGVLSGDSRMFEALVAHFIERTH